ncbi:hypothetical protein ACQPZJ_27625 [Actinoplanes sp. CA-054009]
MSWTLFVMPVHGLARDGTAEWLAAAEFTRGEPPPGFIQGELPPGFTQGELPPGFTRGELPPGFIQGEQSAEFARGEPAAPPPAWPLPTATDVVAAFRAAGCHGTNWSGPPGDGLPECPDPSGCAAAGGLDLGEVTLRGEPVEVVSFRKPYPLAVLAAACALAPIAGPVVVFDHEAVGAFVVEPGENADGLRAVWPW